MSIDQMDMNLKKSTNFSSQGGYEKYTRPSDNFVFGDVPNTVHEKGNIIGELFDTTKVELVADFALSNSTSWSIETGWSLKRGATFSSNGASYVIAKDKISFEKGKTYILEVDVDNLSLTNSYVYLRNTPNTGDAWANSYYQITKNGKTEIIITAESTVDATLRISANNGTINYNYISIKELTSIKFPEAPTANVEGLGSELITNGGFDTDTNGWTATYNSSVDSSNISEGKLTLTRTSGEVEAISQSIVTEIGRTYKFSYEVVSSNLNKAQPYIGTSEGSNQIAVLNSTGAGHFEYCFTATSTSTYITLRMGADDVTVWDNISVKEITGLKTTQSYNIGEMIVLDRAGYNVGTPLNSSTDPLETFSTSGLDIISAVNTTGYGICYWDMNSDLVEGNEYFLTFDFTLNSGTAPMLNFADDTIGLIDRTHFNEGEMSTGSYAVAFTHKANERYVGFRNSSGVSADYSVTNVKFIDKNDIYQATKNTEDMYDYDDTVGTTLVKSNETVVKCTGNNIYGIKNHFYQWIYSADDTQTLSSTNFSLTPFWKDLGSATGYDYENDGATTSITLNDGDIIFNNDGNDVNGLNGHYYKAIGLGGSVSNYNLATANFTSATWQDLGTDINGIGNFMSLKNPYFKVQDKVFRYDIAFHRIDKTTKALDTKVFCSFADGIGGWNSHSNDEVAMQDLFDSDTSSSIKLNKVIGDKNTYEDSDYFYIMIGEVPRLNQGAYHPVYNSLGTNSFIGTDLTGSNPWYEDGADSVNITQTSWCFEDNNSTPNRLDSRYGGVSSGLSYRPDGLFYDKIYPENFNGFTDRRIFTDKYDYNQILSMSKEIQKDRKEAKQVIFSNVNNMLSGSTYLVSSDSYETIYLNNNENLNEIMPDGKVIKIGDRVDLIFISGDTTIFIKGKVIQEDSNGNWFRVDNELKDSSKFGTYNSGTFYYLSTNNVSTSKSITHLDMIGDINNYPKDWLSFIAKGSSIYFNPQLADDNGNLLNPDDTGKEYKLSKKAIHSSDLGTTVLSVSPYHNYTYEIGNVKNIFRNNESLALVSGYVASIPYIADADPLKEDEVKTSKYLENQAIASNHNEIHKAGDIVRVLNKGIIPTGDVLNNKVLENALLGFYSYKTSDGSITVHEGSVLLIDTATTDGEVGELWKRVSGGTYTDDYSSYTNFNNSPDWVKTDIGVNPTHAMFKLSGGAKWYNSLAVNNQDLFLQVHGKTIVKENGDDGIFDESTSDWNGNKIKNGKFNMRLPFRIKE